MITRVWRWPLSAAVIDCHYDATSDTISACDTNGLVILIDSDTVVLSQARVSMPAWGVAHVIDGSGEPLIAVAEARKETSGARAGRAGGLAIIDASEKVRLRIATEAPCWDVALAAGHAWCTSWGGNVLRVPMEAREADEARSVVVGGPAYGLAVRTPGEGAPALLVCVAGRGVLELGSDGQILRTCVPAAAAGYNVTARGATTIAGSTERGSLIIDGSPTGTGPRALVLGEVSAVAIVADEFVVAGDLDGSLALFHVSQLDRPLDGMTLPGGIWNLASDDAAGRVYVACGDGHLYAFELSLNASLSPVRLHGLVELARSRPVEATRLINATSSAIEVAIVLAEIGSVWSEYSPEDVTAIMAALEAWAIRHPSARLSLRLGLAELERSKWDDAIVALQQIDQTSDAYVPSLLPLSEAFDHIGSPRTAINVLKANLDRFPAATLLDVLFRIGELSEKSGDRDGATTAYEAVSFQDHSYPGVRKALARLRTELATPEPGTALPVVQDPMSIAVGPEKTNRLGSRRLLDYEQISYIQYEYGPPADEAKKLLEEHVMAGVLARSMPEPSRSLDIGCATGRWPIWFSRRGWDARGYDISPAAIEICELRAQKMPEDQRPRFSLHDICEGALDVQSFELVSTMMGTFNHVPHTQLAAFLRGIWDSLVPGGVLTFTSWNAQSRFCDFLNLDSERAKEELRRNCLEAPDISARLAAAGFERISTNPIVFLPNYCYDVWEDDLENPTRSFIELDDVLRSHVASNKAQMHFYVAKRPTA